MTLCAQDRECWFGEVVKGVMVLSEMGEMIEKWWDKIPTKFPNVELDAHITMPNHFHGIIILVGADPRVRPKQGGNDPFEGTHMGVPLPRIIQWFKTMATNEYIRSVETHQWPSFHGRLWQRNYYEHIIRDERDLETIREYVGNNPKSWECDEEHPGFGR